MTDVPKWNTFLAYCDGCCGPVLQNWKKTTGLQILAKTLTRLQSTSTLCSNNSMGSSQHGNLTCLARHNIFLQNQLCEYLRAVLRMPQFRNHEEMVSQCFFHSLLVFYRKTKMQLFASACTLNIYPLWVFFFSLFPPKESAKAILFSLTKIR